RWIERRFPKPRPSQVRVLPGALRSAPRLSRGGLKPFWPVFRSGIHGSAPGRWSSGCTARGGRTPTATAAGTARDRSVPYRVLVPRRNGGGWAVYREWRSQVLAVVVAVVALALVSAPASAQFRIPEPVGFINDFANVIPP